MVVRARAWQCAWSARRRSSCSACAWSALRRSLLACAWSARRRSPCFVRYRVPYIKSRCPDMSRNNVILVISHKGRYYVTGGVNADECWTKAFARDYILRHDVRSTRSRGRALVRAHNTQRRVETEYGVWEMAVR